MKKIFAILANSIRTGGKHCVAGREVIQRDGKWAWGPWIRPVSKHGGGALPSRDCICSDDTLAEVLDIVEVPFGEKPDCGCQPENHFVVPESRWRRIKTMQRSSLPLIVEEPDHLWRQPEERSDRIHADHAVGSLTPFQSLFLIRPSDLHFRIWQEERTLHGKPRKHRRAIFGYHAVDYDLPITDPAIDARQFRPFPAPGAPGRVIRPENPADWLLVVSLAAPFTDGYHYKVVAAVLATHA